MKKIYTGFLALACTFFGLQVHAQTMICDSTSNIIIYSNYDGGALNINVDQNIPNLKIGVCSYEAVQINISGTYATNVTKVWYAGYIGTNDNCNLGITTTTINGVAANVDTIQQYPLVTLPDVDGSNNMICAYQCTTGSQGGCNTPQQVAHFFMTKFSGTTVRYHYTHYSCWQGTYNVSTGGNCCLIPVMTGVADVQHDVVVNLFPNPADEQVTVQLSSDQAYTGVLTLRDVLGREVLRQSFVAEQGENTLVLDVDQMPAGIYSMEITTPEGLVKNKLEIK